MTQEERYLAKCRCACQILLDTRDDMPLERIVVFGSLARATLGMSSDIDLMLVLDTPVSEIDGWRKKVQKTVPDHLTDEFPYVDFVFCRKGMYEDPDDSAFGCLVQNCRKDGICVWRRKVDSV